MSFGSDPQAAVNVLAIDTAMAFCSVALFLEGRIAFSSSEEMYRGQSERLVPLIDEALRDCGIDFSALDTIAVTRGPGAFTGVRIGLAAARAFAVAGQLPCLGFTTFDVIAAEVRDTGALRADDILVIALETKRDDIYLAAVTESGEDTLSMRACTLAEAAKALPAERRLVLAGDAALRLIEALPNHKFHQLDQNAVNPAVLAKLAAQRFDAASEFPPTPAYLRAPDVTLPPT